MRAALPILLSASLATCLLPAQEPPPPIPGEEPPRKTDAEPDPAPPKAVVVPLGKKEAKPAVPSVDQLLEASEEGEVEADTMWLIIEHAKRRGLTTIDVLEDGTCQLIERTFGAGGRGDAIVVRAGKGVPASVSGTMMRHARRKTVLFGIGRDRLSLGAGSEQLRVGVAARHGRSVHTSPSAAFDAYPAEVREAVTALLQAARALPVAADVRAVVSAEFVDPRQARRLTAVGGQRLVAVRDPGRDATLLPPAVAAARMPGRKIVVRDALEWERIRSYMTAGGLDPDAGGQCLIAVGVQTFRLSVEVVGG